MWRLGGDAAMRDFTFDSFCHEIENLRSMIEAVEYSIRTIDENMRAFEDLERSLRVNALPPSTSMLELKMRRDNLGSTLATLRRRLESMERTMALQ
jgi:hypothetical protein